MIQFCGAGYTSSYGVFQDFYTQTYLTNSTPSAIAWIGSVNALLIFSVGLVSGRLLDRGAFYHVMKIGCFLQCFFLFMLSLAKPNGYYQIFLSQGIGSGIAIGITNVPSIAVVSHHFQRRRAFVMGLVVVGASMGSILHPIMLNNLINGRLGFANGVRASAGMIGCLLLIAYLLMRTRLPPQPQAVSYTRVFQNSLRDRAYICACLGMAAFEVGFFFVAFYLQLDSRLHGLSEGFSFYSLTIFNAGSFFGRLTASVVSAYMGIPSAIIGCSFISSALIFSMIGLHSVASVSLIGVSYGFFCWRLHSLSCPVDLIFDPRSLRYRRSNGNVIYNIWHRITLRCSDLRSCPDLALHLVEACCLSWEHRDWWKHFVCIYAVHIEVPSKDCKRLLQGNCCLIHVTYTNQTHCSCLPTGSSVYDIHAYLYLHRSSS